MKSESAPTQRKVTEQYVPVAQLIILYKVVLTFKSVDEKINLWHCLLSSDNKSY